MAADEDIGTGAPVGGASETGTGVVGAGEGAWASVVVNNSPAPAGPAAEANACWLLLLLPDGLAGVGGGGWWVRGAAGLATSRRAAGEAAARVVAAGLGAALATLGDGELGPGTAATMVVLALDGTAWLGACGDVMVAT